MRKRDGPSLMLTKRKTWTSPIMQLKARQHQGLVQMSGCCDTSQKEAVSQWKPGGQRRNRLGDKSEIGIKLMQRSIKWVCCIILGIVTSHITTSCIQ